MCGGGGGGGSGGLGAWRQEMRGKYLLTSKRFENKKGAHTGQGNGGIIPKRRDAVDVHSQLASTAVQCSSTGAASIKC